jgi:hypothetical protein
MGSIGKRPERQPVLRVTTSSSKEDLMRRLILTAMLIGLSGAAVAATDSTTTNTGSSNTGSTNSGSTKGGTAKGAAIGAVAGHEVGSGHAMAGAAAGAAIGHHEAKKNAD